jgi:hypothetical protein
MVEITWELVRILFYLALIATLSAGGHRERIAELAWYAFALLAPITLLAAIGAHYPITNIYVTF